MLGNIGLPVEVFMTEVTRNGQEPVNSIWTWNRSLISQATSAMVS